MKDVITREQVEEAYDAAMFQMARLNKNAAMLMHKYNAHAATDVTGFGELVSCLIIFACLFVPLFLGNYQPFNLKLCTKLTG